VATYQKNGAQGVDTLLLLVDRTAHYAVNEEGMDFIALAAHELRGPITVIRGYLDILRPELDSLLSDEQRQLFDRLDVSSSRLSGYVSNILNASKYDRRHLRLHLREDRLADVYNLVADDLALRASTQGRMLTISFDPDLPTVAADRNSLSEVMANLVDNAIKYSNEGGQVQVTATADGDFVRFTVVDQGIGIPASVVGSLFGKFYRSHRSKATVAGTGLGLYISKAIIESHGGKIGLTSTEGQGSTFSFTVPIYATVAEKLLSNGDGNQGIIESSNGWIKNHSMYRG
jgi:signal transduction histidine kinase